MISLNSVGAAPSRDPAYLVLECDILIYIVLYINYLHIAYYFD
jgi:hypothetical protein